jgi:hypothetical protein
VSLEVIRMGSILLMIVQSHEEKVTPLFHVHTSKDKGKKDGK